MADPRYSGGERSLADTVAAMNEVSGAADEMARKEELRRGAEEKGSTTQVGNAKARVGSAEATRRLTEAISANIDALKLETGLVEANTEAWLRNASAQGRATGGVARTASAAAGATPVERPAQRAPVVAPDPGAKTRYEDALRNQAAADARAVQASRSYTSVSRSSGATEDDRAKALATREAAKQAAADARAETAASRANVAAQERLAATAKAELEGIRTENAKLKAALAEHAAAELEAARTARTAAYNQGLAGAQSTLGRAREPAAGIPGWRRELESSGSLALPPSVRPVGVGVEGAQSSLENVRAAAIQRDERAAQALADAKARAAQTLAQERGLSGANANLSRLQGNIQPSGDTVRLSEQNAQSLRRLEEAQRGANAAFHDSVAAYSSSSQALTRHGALTSEFIGSFARGEVTLKEFTSQMVTTIGKFAGWAAAGALVYGAFDALKKVAEGAKEAQSGYVQLTRFIPDIQQKPAEQAFTNISTQLNVPIKDVVDVMVVMARSFKNLSDASDATRAVLLASKLDQIDPKQAAPYLVGISQSFGLTKGSQVLGVVDQLNTLQNQFGARVSQTLPGLAKAAPAALAAGVDIHTLEGLIGVGVRAGITGPQVATAIARSATTFVEKPVNQALLEKYGFDPKQPYGDLIKSISATIGAADRAGKPVSGTELRDLAIGLAGPQLGARTVAAILARGGLVNQYADATRNPQQTALEERQKQLKSVSEQVSGIGIGLENFGASLSTSGILIPLQALLAVFRDITRAASALVAPFSAIGTAVGGLPGPIRDLVGVLALAAAAQAAYRTSFGRTATTALSRIPGFSYLDTPESQARSQLLRTQREGLTFAQNRQEQTSGARLNAEANRQDASAYRQAGQISPGQYALLSTDEKAKYEVEQEANLKAESDAIAKAAAAERAYVNAVERTTEFQVRIAALKSTELSNTEAVAYAAKQGFRVAPAGQPNVLPTQGPERLSAAELAANAPLSIDARTKAAIEEAKGGTVAPERTGALPLGGSAKGEGVIPPAASISGALGGVAPSALGAAAITAAETERPGFIAGKLSQLASKAGGGSAAAAAALALGGAAGSVPLNRETIRAAPSGLLSAAAESALVAKADTALGSGALSRERLRGGLSPLTSGIGAGFGGALGTAFQGILGAQILGGVVPGQAGNFISGVGTAAALGLGGRSLTNSVLEKYGLNQRVGVGSALALGVGVQQLNSSSPISNFAGGGLVGGGLASLLGGSALAGGALGLGLVGLSKLSAALSPAPRDPTPGAPIFHGSSFLGLHGASDIFDFVNPFADNAGTYAAQKAAFAKKDAAFQAQRRQEASLGQEHLNDNQVAAFGATFSTSLQTAFGTTGKAADAAVTSVNHTISVLASNLQAFGSHSQAGKTAVSLLQEAAGQAVSAAGRDSQNVDQYISIAQKATDALTQDAQSTLQVSLAIATNAKQRAGALRTFAGSENTTINKVYTQPGQRAQDSLAALKDRYQQEYDLRALTQNARRRGIDTTGPSPHDETATLNQIGDEITRTQRVVQASRAGAAKQRQINFLTDQANQATVYGQNQADIQASGSLAAAAQGGDKGAALDAQLATARSLLANAKTGLTKHLNPSKRKQEIETITASIDNLQVQVAQNVLANADAAAALAESQVPASDRVGQTLADARSKLSLMQAANSKAGSGPKPYQTADLQQQQATINANLQAQVQEGLANVQARGAVAGSLVSPVNQAAQAQATANANAQALSYIQAHKSGFTTADQLNAVATANQSRLAAAQAAAQQGLTNVQARAGLAASTVPSFDPVATARAALGGAQQASSYIQAHKSDFSYADVLNAMAAVNTAKQAVASAVHDQAFQVAQLSTQIAQARDAGNAIAQAADAAAGAAKELSLARTPVERANAQLNAINAINQANQALEAHFKSQADYLASTTTNVLRQDRIQIRAAAQILAHAQGPDAQLNAKTNLNTLKQKYASDSVSQTDSTIQFQLQMQQITTDQAIKQIDGLLKLKNLSLADRQKLQLEAHNLAQGDSTGGAFDLAPGNIKLPTVLDVRKAIGSVQRNSATATTKNEVHAHASTQVNVYVKNHNDVHKVADAIERVTGGKLRARMRAAGVR